MRKRGSGRPAGSIEKPGHASMPRQEEEAQQASVESESLSPKRIMDGVSTKTKVLDGILARESYQFRHWGINE